MIVSNKKTVFAFGYSRVAVTVVKVVFNIIKIFFDLSRLDTADKIFLSFPMIFSF